MKKRNEADEGEGNRGAGYPGDPGGGLLVWGQCTGTSGMDSSVRESSPVLESIQPSQTPEETGKDAIAQSRRRRQGLWKPLRLREPRSLGNSCTHGVCGSRDTNAFAGGAGIRPGGLEGGMTAEEKIAAAEAIAGGSSAGVEKGDKEYSEANGMEINPETGKDKYLTDPVPEGKPLPVEPQDVEFSDVTHTCTLSVRCDTILDNMDWLDPEKVELVPEDGVIFPATTVTFYEGESVFNVLQREMRKAGIHMEFEDTPMYNSAYIEGINNLYEFDCGELSGWMYKVNGWFPNYGCSRYQLKEGDTIEWVYTCDLGVDVGGFYSTGG